MHSCTGKTQCRNANKTVWELVVSHVHGWELFQSCNLYCLSQVWPNAKTLETLILQVAWMLGTSGWSGGTAQEDSLFLWDNMNSNKEYLAQGVWKCHKLLVDFYTVFIGNGKMSNAVKNQGYYTWYCPFQQDFCPCDYHYWARFVTDFFFSSSVWWHSLSSSTQNINRVLWNCENNIFVSTRYF